jgi:hypothetical protein
MGSVEAELVKFRDEISKVALKSDVDELRKSLRSDLGAGSWVASMHKRLDELEADDAAGLEKLRKRSPKEPEPEESLRDRMRRTGML